MTNMNTEDLHCFLNYQNGRLSLNTYRTAGTIVTDLADLRVEVRSGNKSPLTATIHNEAERVKFRDLIELAMENTND
jgi:hypothetical protein